MARRSLGKTNTGSSRLKVWWDRGILRWEAIVHSSEIPTRSRLHGPRRPRGDCNRRENPGTGGRRTRRQAVIWSGWGPKPAWFGLVCFFFLSFLRVLSPFRLGLVMRVHGCAGTLIVLFMRSAAYAEGARRPCSRRTLHIVRKGSCDCTKEKPTDLLLFFCCNLHFFLSGMPPWCVALSPVADPSV